jgi:hypothetical protein
MNLLTPKHICHFWEKLNFAAKEAFEAVPPDLFMLSRTDVRSQAKKRGTFVCIILSAFELTNFNLKTRMNNAL